MMVVSVGLSRTGGVRGHPLPARNAETKRAETGMEHRATKDRWLLLWLLQEGPRWPI